MQTNRGDNVMQMKLSTKVTILVAMGTSLCRPSLAKTEITDGSDILKRFSASESEERRMSKQIEVSFFYGIPLPKDKEPRIQLTSPSAVAAAFSSGKKNLGLIRWVMDGVRFSQEEIHFSTTGSVLTQFSYFYDGREGRTLVTPNPQDTKDLLPTEARGVGEIDEHPGGSKGVLYGQLLMETGARFLGQFSLNGHQTYQLATTQKSMSGDVFYNLWISPEHSYREERIDQTSPTALTEYKEQHSRREILNFVKFRNTWVPQKWVQVTWWLNRQNQIVWGGAGYTELRNIQSLASEQKSVFSLDFPLGARVSDSTRNTQYVEGEDIMPSLQVLKGKELPRELQDFVTRVVTEETAKNKTAATAQPTKPQ